MASVYYTPPPPATTLLFNYVMLFFCLAQPMYHQAFSSYYPPQPIIDPNFKQQTPGTSVYNYVPMISPTTLQHGNSIPVPILLHQQPSGQIQYVFPTHSLQQQQQPVSFDGQYLPVNSKMNSNYKIFFHYFVFQVYRSDVIPPVVDNNPYSQPPFVHLYPTHPHPQTQQTTIIQPG